MSPVQLDPLGPNSDVVSTARLLLESKARRINRKFLVEGPQNVLAAIDNGLAAYVLTVNINEVSELAKKSGLKTYLISESANKVLADTKTPQGIFAVCNIPQSELAEVVTNKFSVVLDRIADPGNVGTIIRTAAAFGADAVIALAGTADVWSGKVVRSTAGTFAEIRIISNVSSEEFIQWAGKSKIKTFALTGAADIGMLSLDLSEPHLWLVGNEANGLAEELMITATAKVRIPMTSNVESLNAAMAVGICSFASFNAQGS